MSSSDVKKRQDENAKWFFKHAYKLILHFTCTIGKAGWMFPLVIPLSGSELMAKHFFSFPCSLEWGQAHRVVDGHASINPSLSWTCPAVCSAPVQKKKNVASFTSCLYFHPHKTTTGCLARGLQMTNSDRWQAATTASATIPPCL